MAFSGKIERLPHQAREELDDGWDGERVIEWLDALPEVRAVLAEEFGRGARAKHRQFSAPDDLGQG